MLLHSYVALSFAYLGHAVKQQVMAEEASQMAEDAEAQRYRACGERLEHDGRFGVCTCGDHTLVERGDGNGEVFLWR